MDYSEKLKDPRWQKRRLQIFERDKFRCTLCYDDKKTLHVHHKFYNPNTEPWDYSDDVLQTLCEDCHLVVEYFKNNPNEILRIYKQKFKDKPIYLAVIFENGYVVFGSIRTGDFIYGAMLRFDVISLLAETIENYFPL